MKHIICLILLLGLVLSLFACTPREDEGAKEEGTTPTAPTTPSEENELPFLPFDTAWVGDGQST